jgi:tRNA threonylcarbamoyladenosine modification (KEOPS) complex  Pcc1 subunit
LSRSNVPSETSITIEYGGPAEAEAVLRAIAPDNVGAPEGISIDARVEGGALLISVRSSRGLGSLASTLDDLLSCVQAAEAAIKQL